MRRAILPEVTLGYQELLAEGTQMVVGLHFGNRREDERTGDRPIRQRLLKRRTKYNNP